MSSEGSDNRITGVMAILSAIFFIVIVIFVPSLLNIKFGGWLGVAYDIIFLSVVIGGIYFIALGLLAIVTGKLYGPLKD